MVKAAIFERPGQPLEVVQIDVEEPRNGEVQVRSLFSGVCHSDYHVLLGEWTMPLPLVLGHEGAGVVEKVGPGVSNVSVGDHVILSWTPTCRRCRFCVSGRPQLCELAASTAYQCRLPSGETPLRMGGAALFPFLGVGSFSQVGVVTESAVIPIRKDMPLDKAALIGCAVVTGVGSVFNTARVQAGSQVVVIGCGGVGLSVVQGARLAGASRVIAIDTRDDALVRATKMGATATVNSVAEDPRSRVPELTAPGAADYVFEAIGKTSTIELAYELTAPGGTTMVVGQVAAGEMIRIDPYILSEQEKVIRGSNYGSARASIDFPLMVELYMSGMLDLDSLVSRVRPLSEVNEAFEDMARGGVARTVLNLE